jgi:hypothetical protein
MRHDPVGNATGIAHARAAPDHIAADDTGEPDAAEDVADVESEDEV